MKFETQAEAKKAALKETRMAKKNIKEIYDNIPKGTIMDVIWIFSERNREFEEAQIVEASAKPLNLSLEIKRLPQLGLVKPEVKTVEEILLQHSEDDGIQGKPSYLMMSQAISAMARDKDEERRRDLQAIAGSYVFTEEPETMNQLNM